MALSKALIKVYLYPHMKNSCKKVKLLFVLPALVSGGAERVLINLMNATDQGKYERALLTVKTDGELGSLVAPDVAFHKLGLRRFIFCLPALYKKLRQLSPDIVVSTMTHMNFALLLLRPFFPRTRFFGAGSHYAFVFSLVRRVHQIDQNSLGPAGHKGRKNE